MNEAELAEWLADYFNGISNEYPPFDPNNCPITFERKLPIISIDEVLKKMKTAKKTSSVPGDIPALLYDKFPRQLAGIATRIFNQISQDMQWPRAWATEFVTVIPKTRHSSTPGECRNISCTNFLSKLFESFVLQWARDEVTPKSNQFGGEPGCCLLYTSPSPRDRTRSRMPSSA